MSNDNNQVVYFSEENQVNVMLNLNDRESYCEENGLAVFYDEETEDKYRKYFEYNDDEQLELENVKKKTYPN